MKLNFSLKYSPLNLITGNSHPRPGKNFTLKKMTWKWPKIDFLDIESWLFADNRNFRPFILKITFKKNTLPQFTSNIACNDLLFLFTMLIIDTISYWILLKNYTFLRTFIFAWILWWKCLGKTFQQLFLEIVDHARQIEYLTNQPKPLVNQNSDIKEWKRRGIFPIFF